MTPPPARDARLFRGAAHRHQSQVKAISDDASIAQHTLEAEIGEAVKRSDHLAKASIIERAISSQNRSKNCSSPSSGSTAARHRSTFDRNGHLILTNTGQTSQEPANRSRSRMRWTAREHLRAVPIQGVQAKAMLLTRALRKRDRRGRGRRDNVYDVQSMMQESIAGLLFANRVSPRSSIRPAACCASA